MGGCTRCRDARTWTSFSPSATLLTMCRRAALSGLELIKYSALRMSSSSLLWDRGQHTSWWGHGAPAEALPRAREHEPARLQNAQHDMACHGRLGRNKTYQVRLRFWRARGLLSTSGGILFATDSGECTRNAKSVVTVAGGLVPKSRLPIGSDATGRGISNNDCDDGRAQSEWLKIQFALDLEEKNRGSIRWNRGMVWW